MSFRTRMKNVLNLKNYLIWNKVLLAAVIATAAYIPIFLVYEFHITPLVIGFDLLFSSFFAYDYWLTRKISKELRTESAMTRKTFTRYISNSPKTKVIDLLSILPVAVILSIFHLPAVFILLSLTRVYRIFRIYQYFDSIEDTMPEARWPKPLLWSPTMSLFVHWIALLSIVSKVIPSNLNPTTQYNQAVYWVVMTLTTIGYGDITPIDNAGRAFSIISNDLWSCILRCCNW